MRPLNWSRLSPLLAFARSVEGNEDAGAFKLAKQKPHLVEFLCAGLQIFEAISAVTRVPKSTIDKY